MKALFLLVCIILELFWIVVFLDCSGVDAWVILRMFGGYQEVAAYYVDEDGVGEEDSEDQLPLPPEYTPQFSGMFIAYVVLTGTLL